MGEAGFKEKFQELYPYLEKAVSQDYEGFQNSQILLFKFSENIICKVQSEKEGKCAMLRINRPGYHSEEELKNELLWITEINEKTDIHTAEIYRGKDENVLHTFTSGSGRKYTYSMQAFLPGIPLRQLKADSRQEQLKQVGRIAAKLHTMEEQSPHRCDSFARFTWDIPDTLYEGARWGHFQAYADMTKEERQLLQKTAEKIEESMLRYGRTRKNYGLIHADLHSENVLVDGDTMSLIDFDDSGYSWYLYDLGSAVSQQSARLGDMAEAYRKGYEEIRPLSSEDIRMTDTFVLLKRLVRIGWMTSHWENGILAKEGDVYFDVTKRMSEAYLAGRDIYKET